MDEKESGAVSAATETTPEIAPQAESDDPAENVSQKGILVKQDRSRAAQLQWLLLHCGPSGKLIREIRQYCPGFDKSSLSKAKNSDTYGVELTEDVLNHLWQTFAPEEYAKRKRHSDSHRLTKTLRCRVDDVTHSRFIRKSREDGFKDTNESLIALILEYLSKS